MDFILVMNFLAGPVVVKMHEQLPTEQSCSDVGRKLSGDMPRRLKKNKFYCLPLVPPPKRPGR